MTQADNVYMLMPLIKSEANVNMTDSRRGHEGVNALMYAAVRNNVEAIQMLIESG
jgi:ankyrin repeat protein